MSWVGLALIIVAVIAFVLLKTEHGVSRLGNRPFLTSIVAAGIVSLIVVGVVMTVAGFVSG